MHEQPIVSIIIVNLDAAELTLDCIASIRQNTARPTYEVIVVDNGSNSDEYAALSAGCADAAILLRLARNAYYGEANNIGVERASGRYVALLNNDVLVTQGWLENMLEVLEGAYRAGAVGARMLAPDGTLIEAGSYIGPEGWTIQMGKFGTMVPPAHVDGVRVADYCSGACLLMRRAQFLALGGFDPIFEPAYFEDADLGLRLRSLGFFSYYCGRAIAYHRESTTARRLWSAEEIDRHVRTSQRRFFERWRDYLSRRLEADGELPRLAPYEWTPEPGPSVRMPLVLYASGWPASDAQTAMLLRLAATLQDLYDVIIAVEDTVSRCRVYALARQAGATLHRFRLCRVADLDATAAAAVVCCGEAPAGLGPHYIAADDTSALLDLIERA